MKLLPPLKMPGFVKIKSDRSIAFNFDLFGKGMLLKQIAELKDDVLRMRPQVDRTITSGWFQVPRYPIWTEDMRLIAMNCHVFRTCIFNIKKETFRNGYSWEKRFAAKCEKCGEEYDTLENESEMLCKKETEGRECGGKLIEPDKKQYLEIDRWLQNGPVNTSKQNFKGVLYEIEDDINIYDDGYMILQKEYDVNAKGEILSEEIKGIIRGNPVFMRIISDPLGNYGGKKWICLKHRTDQPQEHEGKCAKCGRKLYDAHYVSVGQKETYWIDGEVIHVSKYSPSVLYGFPPILSVWGLANMLINQEAYINAYYLEKRIPNGMMMINTQNMEGLQAWWEKQIQKLKDDPHYIPIIGIEGESAANKAEFLKFTYTLDEMQFIATRDEARDRICALMGVSRIFHMDTQGAGGLNNEGLQIVVTNRATEAAQEVYNENLFPKLLQVWGITDWKLKLKSPEDEDVLADEQIKAQKIANAQSMKFLGFKVKDYNKDFDFEFERVEENSENPIAEEEEIKRPDSYEAYSQTNFTSGMPRTVQRMSKAEETLEKEARDLTKTFWDKAIEAILSGALFSKYEGIPDAKSKVIRDMIFDMFKQTEWDVAKLRKDIEAQGISKEQTEKIVRTEYSAVTNKARELGYLEREKERGEEFTYKWSTHHDDRLSDICKEIEEKVGAGKKMQELKQIISDVSKKHLGKNWKAREWCPHVNCRSVILRHIM